MITTKEISLKFSNGVSVVQINVPHLVTTITIKGIAVGASTIVSMVITAPNLIPFRRLARFFDDPAHEVDCNALHVVVGNRQQLGIRLHPMNRLPKLLAQHRRAA